MGNNIKQEEEDSSELIPNKVGIPCYNDSSELLRKEHSRWRKDVKERRETECETVSYWKNASSCASL